MKLCDQCNGEGHVKPPREDENVNYTLEEEFDGIELTLSFHVYHEDGEPNLELLHMWHRGADISRLFDTDDLVSFEQHALERFKKDE